MRDELGLTQVELAVRFPATSRGERTGQWISGIEAGRQEVKLDELPLFEKALGVDMRWLITGEASGMDEFTARVAELSVRLDARGRRSVMREILGQIEEAEEEEAKLAAWRPQPAR